MVTRTKEEVNISMKKHILKKKGRMFTYEWLGVSKSVIGVVASRQSVVNLANHPSKLNFLLPGKDNDDDGSLH